MSSKLEEQLARKKDELRRRENSCGMYHDLQKMMRLREEIRKIESRLAKARSS